MSTLSTPGSRWRTRTLAAAGAVFLGISMMSATTAVADPMPTDPREGLSAGLYDAGVAASGVEHLATLQKTAGLSTNSDIAFKDDMAIVGNYNGIQFYDVSNPSAPELVSILNCPGSQNDVSVVGDLLFMSVEATSARLDCVPGSSAPVFRGVRVFDISNVMNPVQVAAVQTCRGSHTHTVLQDPDDAENIYIYVSGTAGVRSAEQLAGCNNDTADAANPSRWRIEVIKVPVANPAAAAVVTESRLFADATTGRVDGLQNGPTAENPRHPSGANYSPSPNTNACHDITVYPEIGLAAGACQGNGILIDISDPANPKRIDAVADPNFSYWHSATFNNDGTKVIFTDEWGGGGQAYCQPIHQSNWGANGIFDIVDGKLKFASYYKIPNVQTSRENCVAHNGSLVPVPGRDIMVQAWYQGGMSVFDFTDSANPKEIAFFDRGPISATSNASGGFWSTYWYNGNIYGSELTRGFDSFKLTPSAFLTENELAAAAEVSSTQTNVQGQEHYEHEASFAVAKALVDQAERAGTLTGDALAETRLQIALAEELSADPLNEPATLAALAKAAEAAGEGTAAANALIALAGKLSGGSIPVEATVPQAADGSLALTVADFGDGVSLSQAENAGDRFVFEGELPDLTVTDSRNARQAGDGGWAVAGRSTDLTSIGGSVEASNLGWSPVVKTPRAGLAAGPESVVKLDGGTGLSMTSRLADATADGRMGSATLGAGLFLHLPVNTDPGTYSGALTVSLFPVD